MGQKNLKENATLLRLVKHHFKDFKTKATMSRDTVYWGKLQTFCQLEWPMIQTGWLKEHSLRLDFSYTEGGVQWPPGPDTTVAWRYLVEMLPWWLKPHLPLANQTISLYSRLWRPRFLSPQVQMIPPKMHPSLFSYLWRNPNSHHLPNQILSCFHLFPWLLLLLVLHHWRVPPTPLC